MVLVRQLCYLLTLEYCLRCNLVIAGDPHPVKVYLATFPLHYKLWKKRTGKSLDPRQDAYLWGE